MTDNLIADKKAPFSEADVIPIIKEVFDRIIGFAPYSFDSSTDWNQKCVELVTSELVKLNHPYKYIVTSTLLQTGNGTGVNVSTVSFWNKETDLSVSHRWEGFTPFSILCFLESTFLPSLTCSPSLTSLFTAKSTSVVYTKQYAYEQSRWHIRDKDGKKCICQKEK